MRHAAQPQALFAAVLAGWLWSGAAAAAPAADVAPEGLSPATAAAIARLQAATQGSPDAGRRLFLALNCYSCHGLAAGGAIGPNIVGASRDAVEFNVLNGNAGGMPSFALYVTETDITHITNYLDSIGTPDEPTFVDWWRKNPTK
jgi:mono/diheme cytochrome c family protein